MSKLLFPLLLILSLVACCIEVDISVPGFPQMAQDLGVSEVWIQLTLVTNFGGFCLAALFYGPLSDRYGRRKIMIIGNGLLVIGAIGCFLSSSISGLLIYRFIQGLGASTSAVVVFAMIADCYQGKKAEELIGLMNSIFSLLMAIAPVIGGFINQAIGWRGNYGIVAVISVISWILLILKLPETKQVSSISTHKEIFKDYKTLLNSGHFWLTSTIPSLLYSAYMSFVACSAFLYMETLNIPLKVYAFHQASIISSFSLVSLTCAPLTRKLGTRQSMIMSIGLTSVSSLGFVILSGFSSHSPYLITLPMIIFGIGFAICYPIIFTISLDIFPTLKGTASSVIMAMRALLCSGFVALTSYLYSGDAFTLSIIILVIIIMSTILSVLLLKSPLLTDRND